MRILACHTTIRPETLKALREHTPSGVKLELVDVSGSDYAYWREIKKRWDGSGDLITIEQDMEITAETIPSFQECAEPWCAFWYHGPAWHLFPGCYGDINSTPLNDMAQLRFSLGCTKFSAELQRAVPMADKDLAWNEMDLIVAGDLVDAGHAPHVHGEIKHLHAYEDPPWLKAFKGQ